MLGILWNVLGIGNPWSRKVLSDYVSRYSSGFIFLSETKATRSQIEKLKFSFGYSNGFVVERRGLSGGLALLWKDHCDIKIMGFSIGHIDAIVTEEDGKCWKFIGFYGNPETHLRHHSWDLL